MSKSYKFEYPLQNSGRPQILLIGNGLEYKSGQPSWDAMVDHLTAPNSIPLTKEEKKTIPFPLLYEAISLSAPIPTVLGVNNIKEIETRLKKEINTLKNKSNDLLDYIPELSADHIFTTNYSYCIEKAFFPNKDFNTSRTRTDARFNLLPLNDKNKLPNEKYRLHSGYLLPNHDGTNSALWHIHGERCATTGIIIGHDRYGRLLQRIIDCCSKINYEGITKGNNYHSFKSWPELFLFGDIYIIGFGYAQCEFDLWWLLRRKQRERNGNGKVFFYNKVTNNTSSSTKDVENKLRDKLLLAHGVQILDCGSTDDTSYDDFYCKALKDIKERIKNAKSMRI